MRSEIFDAIIIHDNPEKVQELENPIYRLYPNANIALLESVKDAIKWVSKTIPDIVFLIENPNSIIQFEICTHLRSILGCENIPIIFFTTNTDDDYLKDALNNGCDGYLISPVNESALLMQLKLALKIKNFNIAQKRKSQSSEEINGLNIRGTEQNTQTTLQLLSDLQKEIEARKITENELRASEMRLSRAEIASRSGNWELDLNAQTINASAGAAEIYGTKNLKSNYNIIKIVPLDNYREVLDNALNDLIAGRAPYKVDYKIKRVDNAEIREIRTTATYDKKSNKVFGVVRDITDEVRTQEALYQSETMYTAILKSSPDIIALTDLEGNFLSCSNSTLKTFGYNNEQELIGQNFRNIVAPVDLERGMIDFQKARTGAYSGEPNEYTYIKRDGTLFDLEVTAGLIRNSNGEISKLLYLARDVTERKKNEQRILKSEIEFRSIWENSPNGLGLVDENGNIVRVNNALSDIFERKVDDFKGVTLDELIPTTYRKDNLKIHKDLFRTRSLLNHLEVELDRKNGEKRWLHIDFSFLDFQDEKSMLLFIINDVTNRKTSENRIRNLTRLYALQGQINQSIVRQRNDLKLMQQICDVAIRYGEFKFAWFGEYNSTYNTIKFVCESGKSENYIQNIETKFPYFKTDTKTYEKIIEKKEIACCNEISNDTEMLFMPSEALKNGFQSMAILPIERKGAVNYLLYIYSDKIDFFKQEEEQKLLSEMAQSISLAIETIDAEKVRVETENALKESENRYNAFINNNVDMIFVKDNQFRFLVVNDSFERFIGIKKDQILNKTNKEFSSEERYIECFKSDKRALLNDTPIVVLEKIGDRIFETTRFKMPLKDGQFGIGGIMHDITNRNKQEIALEESRLELQSIYNNAPVLMCLLDENKNILFKNEEFKRSFDLSDNLDKNLTIGDILGCNDEKLHHKICKEKDCRTCSVQLAIEKTLTDGTTQRNFEYHSVKNADATADEIYLLGSSSLIHSSGKRKILLTFNDITDRKKAEKELSSTNKRLELAMDVANMAWWESDLVTGKIDFGKKRAELLGYSTGYFKNFKDLRDLIHPEDSKFIIESYLNHLKGNTDKVEVEYRLRAKDGKYRYFYDIGSISRRSSDGKPLALSGLMLDITDRKISVEALEKSEILLRTFINNTPFQIWARDINHVGILENKMLVQNFGSILGKNLTDDSNIPPKFVREWEKQNNLVLGGAIIDEEMEYIRNGEKINYQQITFPINVNDKIIGIAGFTIDITERKKNQIALHESQEQLKKFAAHLQYVREEERVSLSREIHDELGQILVAMKFDLGMLKQKTYKTSDKPEIELYEHLSMLVDNTLKTTRRIMTDLRPEILDMLGFVDAVKSHISSFEERQDIICVFQSKVNHLQLDSERSVALYRILQESLTNILKHAKATKIVVKLEKLKENNYYLEIADNGCGFDTSKKSKSDSYGLLGMSERAYLLDAKLTVKSTPNKGTIIRIDFQV